MITFSLQKFLFVGAAPLVLLVLVNNQAIRPAAAILNCFTPNMFRGGKVGGAGMPLGGGPYGPKANERVNWYASQAPYAGQQNPMRLLFQPKWRSPLFGPKRWMDTWRTGPGVSFYRPGYGYMSAVAPAGGLAHVVPAYQPPQVPTGGYQPNEPTYNLNSGPYNYNSQSQNDALVGPNSNSYASWSQQINDGWSAPAPQGQNQAYTSLQDKNNQQQLYNQQQAKYPQLNSYDSYNVLPTLTTQQPAKQVYSQTTNLDPYGTKGTTLKQQQALQQQYGTTKKSVLVADGGFNSFDALLMGSANGQLRNNSTAALVGGYTYPDWYSSTSTAAFRAATTALSTKESPAKIGQQLYNRQLRRRIMGGDSI